MQSLVGPPDQGGPGEVVSLPAGRHTGQNGEAQRQEEAAIMEGRAAENQARVDAGADTVVLPGEAMVVDVHDDRWSGDEGQSSLLSRTGLRTEDEPGDPGEGHGNQAVEGGDSGTDKGMSQKGLNLSESGGRERGQEGRSEDDMRMRSSRTPSSEGKAKTFAGQDIVAERTFVTNGGQTLRSVRLKSVFQTASMDDCKEDSRTRSWDLKELVNRTKGPLERTPSSGGKPLSTKVAGLALAHKRLKQKAVRVKGQTDVINHVMEILGNGQNSKKIELHRRTEAECKSKYVAVEEPIDSQSFPLLIFHPYTTWRIAWDICVMFLLVYSFVSVPLR